MRRAATAAAIALTTALAAPLPSHAYYDADSPACARVRAVARQVGWPVRELKEVGRIAARESLCSNSAINFADPFGGSHCALQLNGSNRRFLINAGVIKSDMAELRGSLRTCLRGGLELWKRHGWIPWRGASTTPTS
jgi:hypothetical protein